MKKMKRGLLSIFLATFMIFAGCASKKHIEETGQIFLADAFTTNYECRWDNYKDALKIIGSDPVKKYYSDLETLCTEDGLNAMSANRFPFKYDELAEKYGYTFKPSDISVNESDEQIAFTLNLEILSEEKVIGTIKQSGQLQIVSKDGDELVDSIWIADFNELVNYLDTL